MENVLSKMADNLVKLIILLLFISFRPISSNSVKNQEGKLLKDPVCVRSLVEEYFIWEKKPRLSGLRSAHGTHGYE